MFQSRVVMNFEKVLYCERKYFNLLIKNKNN